MVEGWGDRWIERWRRGGVERWSGRGGRRERGRGVKGMKTEAREGVWLWVISSGYTVSMGNIKQTERADT